MLPRRLEIQNFNSFTKADLDLSNVTLAVITGMNGHGKSSLIDAMLYALTGEARTKRGNGGVDAMVRHGQTTMSVTFEWAMGDTFYRVSRTRKTTGGGTTTCTLWVRDGDKWKDISGKTPTETSEKIEGILSMDYETLTRSAVIRQGKADAFSTADPADRKKVLASILGLTLYQEAAERVKMEGQTMKARVEALRQTIGATQIEDETQLREEIARLEAALQEAQDEAAESQGRLNGLRKQKEALGQDVARYDALVGEQQRLEQAIAQIDREITDLRNRRRNLETLSGSVEMLEQQVNDLGAKRRELEALDEKGRQVNALNLELKTAQNQWEKVDRERRQAVMDAQRTLLHADEVLTREIDVLGHEVNRLRESAARLEGLPCNDNGDLQKQCRLIEASVRDRDALPEKEALLAEKQAAQGALTSGPEAQAVQQAKDAAEAPNPHDSAIAEIKAKIAAIGYDPNANATLLQSVRSLDGVEARLTEAKTAQAQIDGIDAQITKATDQKSQTQADLQKAIDAAAPLKDKIAEWHSVNGLVLQEEQQLELNRSTSQTQDRLLARAQERMNGIMAQQNQLADTRTQLAQAEKEYNELGSIYSMLGRNGVQAYLIDRELPALEQIANDILGKIVPGFAVELRTQRASKSGDSVQETLDIIVHDNGSERPLDQFSGGERFDIDLALRIALSKLLIQRQGAQMQTLIVDEGFGSQDPDRLAKVIECLGRLSEDFPCIIVISHVESMVDQFPCRIHVQKTSDGSTATVMGG